MRFVKYHGLGNDYLFAAEDEIVDPAAIARLASNRRFGIGSDGIILYGPSERADARMRIFNPDGSEAEMCGNGIRSLAKLLHDEGKVRGESVLIETAAGLREIDLIMENGTAVGARVDMGRPILKPSGIPANLDGDEVVSRPIEAAGRTFRVTCVSMGNPHAVIYLPSVDDIPIREWGPAVETHPIFPERTNVEFVRVLTREHLRQRTWERGAGETSACGTGASAVAVASVLNGLTGRKVTVHLNGGDLEIEWREDDHVMMTGPAVRLFEVEIERAVLESSRPPRS